MIVEPQNTDEENVNNDGETIDELAHRHMKDQNHVVTDEEIRGAKMNPDAEIDYPDNSLYKADNSTLFPPIPGEPTITEKDEDSTKDTPPNPYDVLKS